MTILWSILLSWFLVGVYGGLARRNGWGQTVRADGPVSHLSKSGTPNMGGVPMVLAFLIVWLIGVGVSGGADVKEVILMLATLGMGAIGFLDDFIKVRDRQAGRPSDGLQARYKLGLQFLVAIAFGVAAAKSVPLPAPQWGIFFDAPLYTVVLIAAVNAFNFTDGLDGLLGGVTLIVLLPMLAISPVTGLIVGAILGFLWYNSRPASVFMGDTGSFALGAAAASVYILYGWTWTFPVAAFIPVLVVLSVFIQVLVFRRTGRRFFKMAPLHHHFEKLGMLEEKVTARFWLVSALSTLLAWVIMNRAL